MIIAKIKGTPKFRAFLCVKCQVGRILENSLFLGTFVSKILVQTLSAPPRFPETQDLHLSSHDPGVNLTSLISTSTLPGSAEQFNSKETLKSELWGNVIKVVSHSWLSLCWRRSPITYRRVLFITCSWYTVIMHCADFVKRILRQVSPSVDDIGDIKRLVVLGTDVAVETATRWATSEVRRLLWINV